MMEAARTSEASVDIELEHDSTSQKTLNFILAAVKPEISQNIFSILFCSALRCELERVRKKPNTEGKQ
jgi:hypothetical protein